MSKKIVAAVAGVLIIGATFSVLAKDILPMIVVLMMAAWICIVYVGLISVFKKF